MGKDGRPPLTRPLHAILCRAAEMSEHLGTPGRLPPLAMQFVASTVLVHGNPNGALRALRDDGWVRTESDAYAFNPAELPTRTDHLTGVKPKSVPDRGMRNAARHWLAGERNLSERHLLAIPGAVDDDAPSAPEPPPRGRARDDRLVAASAPPARAPSKPAPAAASPRPAPRLTMTAEGIDRILVRHVLAEKKKGGGLTLTESGSAFRGQVSESQGYAARMKLKEDGLYEPVHVDESTVLWRVTDAGRARVAEQLAAERARLAAAEQPNDHTEETAMPPGKITHVRRTWPERPVEAGGTRENYPRNKVPGIELDDVDKAIIDACLGQPDYGGPDGLRVQIMRVRRLSPGQVDGRKAVLTRTRPAPAAPAATTPPAKPAAPAKAAAPVAPPPARPDPVPAADLPPAADSVPNADDAEALRDFEAELAKLERIDRRDAEEIDFRTRARRVRAVKIAALRAAVDAIKRRAP